MSSFCHLSHDAELRTNPLCFCVPVCFRYDSGGLTCISSLGPGFLPEGTSRVSRWQEANQLPGCHHSVLLALLHYRSEGHHLCSVCLRVSTVLWHLHRAALVYHDLLDCPLWNRLLHQQVGGDRVRHGGGHHLHLFLVQCKGGKNKVSMLMKKESVSFLSMCFKAALDSSCQSSF